MANLEVAADELVRKLKSVDEEVTEARQGLARLTGQIASLGEALDEQWIEVAKAVADLLETASEELGTLEHEAQETTQAVASLEATGHAAEEAARAGLEAAEQGTTSLAEAAAQRAPQVDGAAESGDQALAALEAHAGEVAAELERVMEQARAFLTGEVVSALETSQGAIADRVEAARATIVEECAAAVRKAYEEWADHLEEAVALVEEQGFLAMAVQARQVVDWALPEVEREYEGELELLVGIAGLVERTLETLRDETLPDCADQVGGDEGAVALAQAVAETERALGEMTSALDAVRQVMARYSFVDL